MSLSSSSLTTSVWCRLHAVCSGKSPHLSGTLIDVLSTSASSNRCNMEKGAFLSHAKWIGRRIESSYVSNTARCNTSFEYCESSTLNSSSSASLTSWTMVGASAPSMMVSSRNRSRRWSRSARRDRAAASTFMEIRLMCLYSRERESVAWSRGVRKFGWGGGGVIFRLCYGPFYQSKRVSVHGPSSCNIVHRAS